MQSTNAGPVMFINGVPVWRVGQPYVVLPNGEIITITWKQN